MVREQSFFIELLSRINYQQSIIQTSPINLGGTSGSGGGSGAPPGGFYGSLPQSRVAGDTTESFEYTSGSVVSLLSNLNNLRAYAEPASWFFSHETIPASQSLTIMPGLWHFSSGSVVQSVEQDYLFVPPAGNNRIDLLYVHTGGFYDVVRGTSAVNPVAPSIPSPTSGSMPLAYIYLRSSGSAVHNIDRGENYILQDLRPFLNWGLGGAVSSVLLDPSTPQPVGSSGVVGTSGSASHGDHVHQGVSSVSSAGGSYAYGNIQIVSGTNISISQSSGSITINNTVAAGGVVFDTANPLDIGSAADVGTSGSPPHADHVHRGVSSVSARGGNYAYGNIQLVAGSNVSLTQTSGSITIAANSGSSGGGNVTYESAYASPPGSPAEGDLWFITDSWFTARRGASDWSYYWQGSHVNTPPNSGWTWFNQGSATLADFSGVQKIFCPAGTGGDQLRGNVRSVTAPYTLIARIKGFYPPGASSGFGLCARQSSDGKLKVIYHQGNNANNITAEKWNSPTSWNSTITAPAGLQAVTWPAMYYRIMDNNTNFSIAISPDGQSDTWYVLWDEARTTFATCDQVGFFTYTNSGTYPATCYLFDWIVT